MIRRLWNKYKEYILYIVFGGLTTVVNYIVYVPLTMFLGVPELIANVIAWIAAVAFAYITNRIWVFNSKTRSLKGIIREILEFALARVASLGIEEAIIGIFVTWLGFNNLVVKVIASVITVILNYFFSKFIIFKNKPDPSRADDSAESESVSETDAETDSTEQMGDI